MKIRFFKSKLIKAIENYSDKGCDGFVTDTIDMNDIRQKAIKHYGFDEVLLVNGEGEDEVFLLYIQKI